MKRPQVKQNHSLSPKLIVAGFVALMIILLGGIVFWPSEPPTTVPPINASETPLGAKLDDPLTHAFLDMLHQVDPEQSRLLHDKAETILAEGGSEDDLALEMVTTIGLNPLKDFKYLAQADVQLIETMISSGQSELWALSNAKSKFCQMATYEAFQHMQPDAIMAQFGRAFHYKSRAYNWMLRFGTIQMQAIQDGHANPKRYKRLSRGDAQALQEMLTETAVFKAQNKLMRLDPSNMQVWTDAAKTLDMCSIVADALSSTNRFQPAHKGPVMVEFLRLPKDTAIREMARQLYGDQCTVCDVIF